MLLTLSNRPDRAWILSWSAPPASYTEAFGEACRRMKKCLPEFLEAVAEYNPCFDRDGVREFLEKYGSYIQYQARVLTCLARNPTLTAPLRREVERWSLREEESPFERRVAVEALEEIRKRAPRGRGKQRLLPESAQYLLGVCTSSRSSWDVSEHRAFEILTKLPEVEEKDWLRLIEAWSGMRATINWTEEIRQLARRGRLTLEIVRRLSRLPKHQMDSALWSELIRVPGAWEDAEVASRFQAEAPMESWSALLDHLPEVERGRVWRGLVRKRCLSEPIFYLERRAEQLESLLGTGRGAQKLWALLVESRDEQQLYTLCRISEGERLQQAFARLNALYPRSTLRWLKEASADPAKVLDERTIAILLSSPSAEVRLAGIQLMGRAAKPQQEPTPSPALTAR